MLSGEIDIDLADGLQKDMAAVTEDSVMGSNVRKDKIVSNLVLPEWGKDGTEFAWESDYPDVID